MPNIVYCFSFKNVKKKKVPQIFRFFHSGSFSASSSSSDSSANMGSGWVLSEETARPVQNGKSDSVHKDRTKLHIRLFFLAFLAGSKVPPVPQLYNYTSLLNIYGKLVGRHHNRHQFCRCSAYRPQEGDVWGRRAARWTGSP